MFHSYIDGAAVLGQGVKEAHLGLNGHAKSDWDYELVAIVYTDVIKARAPLEVKNTLCLVLLVALWTITS